MKLTAVCLLLAAPILQAADLAKTEFRGWPSYRLSNGIITLDIAPALGGRIVGYSLAAHQFLWTNPSLAGELPPPTGLGPKGEWLNWGGDKLWPAPQGWDGPHQWPGPPDAILDGSPHRAEVIGPVMLRLSSGSGSTSGIRLSRVIRVDENSSIVRIRATMTNVDDKPRRWGIWTVTQLDAGARDGSGLNPQFRTFVPVNPASRFPGGYSVLFGDKANPQFTRAGSLLRAHYQRRGGKVGLDSPAGWVATVDGTSGDVFVQTFRYNSAAPYPDGSSVEVWTNGLGVINAWGRDTVMPDNVTDNPHVVESELISPFASVQPGESYDFEYEWRATNIGRGYEIVSCSEIGCTCEPLSVHNNTRRLAGRFGVFYAGNLRLAFLDANGNPVGRPIQRAVNPAAPIIVGTLFETVQVPAAATTAVLSLHSASGASIGELARSRIQDR